MPRYYIDTFNGIEALDNEGQDLPDNRAALVLVRRTLAAMMHDSMDDPSSTQFRADVRDATGKVIMTATLRMILEDDAALEPGAQQ